jgi:hypothetical protein
MLLLNRKTNVSITGWTTGRKEAPLVIRVVEVSPIGVVTLGFDGDAHIYYTNKIDSTAIFGC